MTETQCWRCDACEIEVKYTSNMYNSWQRASVSILGYHKTFHLCPGCAVQLEKPDTPNRTLFQKHLGLVTHSKPDA